MSLQYEIRGHLSGGTLESFGCCSFSWRILVGSTLFFFTIIKLVQNIHFVVIIVFIFRRRCSWLDCKILFFNHGIILKLKNSWWCDIVDRIFNFTFFYMKWDFFIINILVLRMFSRIILIYFILVSIILIWVNVIHIMIFGISLLENNISVYIIILISFIIFLNSW